MYQNKSKLSWAFFFKSLFIVWYHFLLRQLKNVIVFHRTINNTFASTTMTTSQNKYQKFPSLLNRPGLNDHTFIFDVTNTLRKSTFLFQYFILVVIVLGVLYPFIYLSWEKMILKIMIMIMVNEQEELKKKGEDYGCREEGILKARCY